MIYVFYENRPLLITITLFIVSPGCNKSKSTSNGSQYTASMGGARVWHGTDEEAYLTGTIGNETYVDNTYAINNDTASVTIINDTTISVFSYTLPLVSYDPSGSILTFSTQNNTVGPMSVTLIYNYAANSMSYYYSWQCDDFDRSTISLSTP